MFLFAKALKEQFAPLPLIYFGTSFGGTKGALVNLLLSNKDNLIEMDTGGVFNELLPVLQKQDKDLFTAYILREGGYEYVDKILPYYKNPLKTERCFCKILTISVLNQMKQLNLLSSNIRKEWHQRY